MTFYDLPVSGLELPFCIESKGNSVPSEGNLLGRKNKGIST